MSYCLNPSCFKPQNPQTAKFCQTCGMRLLLGDRYRAFNLLSSGASRTFWAIDTRKLVDPRCIIKQFTNSDPERFRQDVARLSDVSQHPQVPDILAYFERLPHQYVVQEFIEGRSLLQQMTEDGSFDEAQIRQLLQEILPLLQFLHDRQILHRDIKSANLIRQADDRPLMLVDFGSAKRATQSALAKTGTVLGSAEYAAPEQLMGKAIVPSDLYSLGVTCIHLLTGLRPFDLYNSADGTWLWRSVAGSVSSDLGQVLDRLLQNDANQRYPSATAVMKALGQSIAPAPIQTAATQPVTHSQSWTCVKTLTVHMPVNAIAHTSDQQRLAIGGTDPALQLWNLNQSQSQLQLTGHTQAIAALAISSDGQTLISGSWDHTLNLWDLATGSLRQTLAGHTDVVTAIAVSASGQFVLSASRDKTIRLWELATGKRLHTFQEPAGAVETLALGTDDRTLVSGSADGTVQIWDVGTRELLRTLPHHVASVDAVALQLDRQLVITGSWDMTLELRNLHTSGLRHRLTGHLLPIAALAISPTGQTLAAGSHDHIIRLWNLDDGCHLAALSGHAGAVQSLAFLSEDTLISGSQDQTIKLWQLSEF